jgi:hypothetical protein
MPSIRLIDGAMGDLNENFAEAAPHPKDEKTFDTAAQQSLGVGSSSSPRNTSGFGTSSRKEMTISEVPAREVPTQVGRFVDSVAKYATGRNEWNQRATSSRAVARPIATFGNHDTATERYSSSGTEVRTDAGLVGNDPVALMLLAHKGGADPQTGIEYLATHPGTKGAGQAMLETAVSASQVEGHNGQVSLRSLSGSRAFFDKAGFKTTGNEGQMRLDPAAAEDIWSKSGSSWTLKSADGRDSTDNQRNDKGPAR